MDVVQRRFSSMANVKILHDQIICVDQKANEYDQKKNMLIWLCHNFGGRNADGTWSENIYVK